MSPLKRLLLTLGVPALLMGAGCGREFDTAGTSCDGRAVCALTLAVHPGDPTQLDDGSGVAVVFDIGATIPNLKGGVRARMNSSVGTLEENSAEDGYTVYLAQVGLEGDGKVEGSVTLKLPWGRQARVRIELGEAVALAWVGPYEKPEEVIDEEEPVESR